MSRKFEHRRYVALSGGVGGAKLALGLCCRLEPEDLLLVANTGDDFEHLGLHISPDIDTLVYTLAGLNDTERGWGRENETWECMDSLNRLGAPTWFRLGDRDLATHLWRTAELASGKSLSQVTQTFGERLGIGDSVVPMSDQAVRTVLETEAGDLPFQEYFVKRQCEPAVRRIRYEGAATAEPAPALREALRDPALAGIFICPSNPYLSIDPILAVPGLTDMLIQAPAPLIAVSPLIGRQAIKGPTAKIMRELGITPGTTAILEHYRGLIDALIVDTGDRAEVVPAWAPPILHERTLMRTLKDRVVLADACIAAADELNEAVRCRLA